jgi:hypothetical protein
MFALSALLAMGCKKAGKGGASDSGQDQGAKMQAMMKAKMGGNMKAKGANPPAPAIQAAPGGVVEPAAKAETAPPANTTPAPEPAEKKSN